MTNDLKNFLEKYHDNKIFSDDQLGEIQSVIIPTVLDIVMEEIEKKKRPIGLYSGRYIPDTTYNIALYDISTIINNLKVK